jgi:hypothetical protein
MAPMPYTSGIDEKEGPRIEEVSSNESQPQPQASTELEDNSRMNKAKWLALFALGLSYMTAFQQSACIGAIVKSIDEALGRWQYDFQFLRI